MTSKFTVKKLSLISYVQESNSKKIYISKLMKVKTLFSLTVAI